MMERSQKGMLYCTKVQYEIIKDYFEVQIDAKLFYLNKTCW